MDFKVGDWVKQVKENYSNYNKCFKIKAVLNDNLYIVESNIFDIDAIQNTDSQFELWEPNKESGVGFGMAINNHF